MRAHQGGDREYALSRADEGIGRTYAKGDFVNSPIDNVLVAGPVSSASFSALKLKGADNEPTFGSDHYPVVVRRAP